MNGKERIAAALEGRRPDRVPVFTIYNSGYVMRATGYDVRAWETASPEERIRYIEDGFRLHADLDGFFVHIGAEPGWAEAHDVEQFEGYWRITNRDTGEQYGLWPDGNRCDAEGQSLPISSFGESLVQSIEDIDAVLPVLSPEQIEASGRFEPLRRLRASYPDRHFTTQTSSPFIGAINACGGLVQGLTAMAFQPDLFRALLERETERQIARLDPATEAGADSTLFTCYYTGADTIAPSDYASLVFPFEEAICAEAKRRGLYVLDWYLGGLMPNLDTVMRLPIDALVLEQGRKGYSIDLGEIRARVGPSFCLFGFGIEGDYCAFNREGLTRTLEEQYAAAGQCGAFVAGTPLMPPDAQPAAVDYYLDQARRLGHGA